MEENSPQPSREIEGRIVQCVTRGGDLFGSRWPIVVQKTSFQLSRRLHKRVLYEKSALDEAETWINLITAQSKFSREKRV